MTKFHTAVSSVVERHRFDVGPDPDTTLSFAHAGKSDFLLFLSQQCHFWYIFLYLFRQRHRRHSFQYFGQYNQIFWLEYSSALHLVEIDTTTLAISRIGGF